jgi:hypothetical protein
MGSGVPHRRVDGAKSGDQIREQGANSPKVRGIDSW